MFDTLTHKYLRIPYRLHVHTDQKVKRSRATVLLLHGIGNSGASWDAVAAKIPKDVRVISVDLLGFGRSPSPRWTKYNVAIQAQSVATTLLGLGIRRPLIIVGHSMGSLTAIEIARRYPFLVKSLILCSPPLYDDIEARTLLPRPDKVLKDFYQFILKNPTVVVSAAPLATKLKIVGRAFDVTAENIDIYLAALESSIIHQTSLDDIVKIKKPIHLIHGALDPVVIKKNLDQVAKVNENTKLTIIPAGHELLGLYIPAVVKAIKSELQPVS
jgi:pimeloyl-ACP methyl ester carboxylesterase